MKLSYNHRILTSFFSTFLILGIVAAMVSYSFSRLQDQKQWVDHTQEVIVALNETLAALVDAQAAQRGYVITGQDDYLAPYHLALPKVERQLQILTALSADNKLQSDRLARLKGKMQQRLDLAAVIIEAYQDKGQEAAFALVRRGTGKQEMDEIRAGVNEMIAEERRLLTQRQDRVAQATEHTTVAGGISLLMVTLILLASFWQIHRETVRRTNVEDSLKDSVEEKEKLTKEAILIAKMGDYLQSCRTVDEAFSLIANHLPELLPNTHGTIALFDPLRNHLEERASWGKPGASTKEFQMDECWGLRRGRMHIIQAGGTEPVCQHLHGVPKGGSMCLPMQAHGETFGMFYIASDDEGLLDESMKRAIPNICEQSSLAIANLKLQSTLRQQSIRDPLTQLFNRRYLEETMERELSRAQRSGQPVSLLMIDVDHFKKINDTHGHDGGDAILVQLAHELRMHTRKEDVVCRYGGEEFLIAMPGADTEKALARAEALRTAARDMKIQVNGAYLDQVTISVGIATYPQNGDLLKTVIAHADAALYSAKNQGRDRIVLAPASSSNARSAEIERLIDNVIAENAVLPADFKSGKDALFTTIVEKVMARANDSSQSEMVHQILRKRLNA